MVKGEEVNILCISILYKIYLLLLEHAQFFLVLFLHDCKLAFVLSLLARPQPAKESLEIMKEKK